MRTSLLCALLLWICASAFSPTHAAAADSGDPGDAFVEAWMLVEQAERTERAGNLMPALEKFREAATMLDKISKDYPSWSPAIVIYRKERTAQAIAQLEEKLGFYGPPAPLPRATTEFSATPQLGFGGPHRDNGEPGDAFVKAWTIVQEAENDEVAGNFKESLATFQEAARILDKIFKDHPKWQPDILNYRKERTKAAIERLQEKLGQPDSPAPTRKASSHRDNAEPGDAFVDAWKLVFQAEKSEDAGNLKLALTTFRQAATTFDRISRDYPSWCPTFVKYRKELTAESIARLQWKLGQLDWSASTPWPAPSSSPRPLLRNWPEPYFPEWKESGNGMGEFLEALTMVRAAEKAEQARRFKQALAKFRQAARKFDKISQDYPFWSNSIVSYRKERSAAAIARLQWRVKHPHLPVPAPLQPPPDPQWKLPPPRDWPDPVPFPEPKDPGNGIIVVMDRGR